MNLKLEDVGEMLKEEIVKGTPVKIENRTLYPIIQVSTLNKEGKYYFKSILPIAIAVIEPHNKYLISLKESESPVDYPELDLICAELGIKTKVEEDK